MKSNSIGISWFVIIKILFSINVFMVAESVSVVTFFHCSFVKFVVNFDNFFNQVFENLNKGSSSHEFGFEIIIRISLKYGHKYVVIPINTFRVLLKLYYVFRMGLYSVEINFKNQ